MKAILVTGGAGFIGSYTNKLLNQSGYQTIIFDNLSIGDKRSVVAGEFVEGDLADRKQLDKLFAGSKIDAVMHFAASTDVNESVKNPQLYYKNNFVNTIDLLETMLRHNVNHFIFSSTAALYGYPETTTINENHPMRPLNPYGHSKQMVETLLHDYQKAYGLRFISLRYFNAAGGDPEEVLKNYKQKECNLIPIALKSLLNDNGKMTIFGTDYNTPDGTCVRDYIHIHDVATAHLLALNHLLANKPSAIYNLGNGQGFSVREVLRAIEKVTGLSFQITEGPRRPGDSPMLVANSSKAQKELNWKPIYTDLETIILHAWKSLQEQIQA